MPYPLTKQSNQRRSNSHLTFVKENSKTHAIQRLSKPSRIQLEKIIIINQPL